MTDSLNGTSLEGLRAQLDEIDERLLRLVRERIELIVRIAEYKREHDVPMMQPHRVDAKYERATAFAVENGLGPAYLRRLYEVIIEESCRVEDEVIGVPDGQRDNAR